MRVLLDSTVMDELAEMLNGFNVLLARRMGLDRKPHSQMLQEAADMTFDVVVTTDRKMSFPDRMLTRPFGIVVLDILPATEEMYKEQLDRIRSGILSARAGEISTVRWPRR